MCFIHFSLCSLILTYWFKNKSTINENVVCIFCIICSSVFCIFLQVKKKKRGQKEFNLFNLIVGHYYYFVWAYNSHFLMYLQFNITQTFALPWYYGMSQHSCFYAFCTALRTIFATPHRTIASIGFTLNLRSSINAITKNTIICTHTFWRIRFTVPSRKIAEIRIVTPAFAIIATTAGRSDPNVPWSNDIFRYFI